MPTPPDLLQASKRVLDDRRRWRGLDVSIENRSGSTRHWVDGTRSGSSIMFVDYGYFRLSRDNDGEHVDVFLGQTPDDAGVVWVVKQMRSPKFTTFDENKVLIGFEDGEVARQTYLAHYDNPRFFGGMSGFEAEAFAEFMRIHRRVPEPGELPVVGTVAKSSSAPDDETDEPDDPVDDDDVAIYTMVMPDGTVLRSIQDAQDYAAQLRASRGDA